MLNTRSTGFQLGHRPMYDPRIWLLVVCLSYFAHCFRARFLRAIATATRVPTETQDTKAADADNVATEDLPAPKKADAETPIQSPIQVPAVTPVPTPFVEPEIQENAAAKDRPYLGVTVEQMEGGGVGLRVVQVTNGSPGWKAGITPGDHLLAINGDAVSSLDQLAAVILPMKPGNVIKCLIDRRGQSKNLPVVLGSSELAARTGNTPPSAVRPYVPIGPQLSDQYQPDPQSQLGSQANGTLGNQYQPDAQARGTSQQRAMLGVTVERLSESVREQLGIPTSRGAVVQAVAPNSPAQRGGLVPGDCIVGVDGLTIDSDVDLMNWILTATPGRVVDIQFHRGRVLQTTKVRLERTNAPVQSQSQSQQRLMPSKADTSPDQIVPGENY